MKEFTFKFYKEGKYVCTKKFKCNSENEAMHMADTELRHYNKYDDWEIIDNIL